MACALSLNPGLSPDEALLQVATRRFDADSAPAVVESWKAMSTAFQEFPYDIGVVYSAPLQMGPSNPLWPTPTAYHATMAGIPYDDMNAWRSLYPPEVFARQLEKVADGFDAAQSKLLGHVTADGELRREMDVAMACALHFRSVAQQTRFVGARDALLAATSKTVAEPLLAEVDSLVRAERDLALKLHAIQCRDPRIGFEATNHYFYTPNDLAEKVIDCEYMLQVWLPEQRARVAALP